MSTTKFFCRCLAFREGWEGAIYAYMVVLTIAFETVIIFKLITSWKQS